jgi:hypothetical protein
LLSNYKQVSLLTMLEEEEEDDDDEIHSTTG